jgi:hypothetical protein
VAGAVRRLEAALIVAPMLSGKENVVLDHPLSPTTHTVEMDQLHEINERLAAPRNAPVITAQHLGLPLPASAVLVRLDWDGPPEYPYIHGHFAASGGQSASLVAELHTSALHQLSRLIGVQHRWGV